MSLYLSDTLMSDCSPLTELKSLQKLDFFDTQVSDQQVQELQKALPYCEIYYD